MVKVEYYVYFNEGVDIDQGISELERVASEAGHPGELHLRKFSLLPDLVRVVGSTTPEVYEALFDCKIYQQSELVAGSVVRKYVKIKEITEWIEKTPAKIPAGLENYIALIELLVNHNSARY